MSSAQPIAKPPSKNTGRREFWLGIILAVLAPGLYMAQIKSGHLTVPWYALVLGTGGFLLMIASFARARTIGRFVFVALLGLLAFGEWYFLLSLSKLPPYSGPVAVGQPFPVFATTWADGLALTQAHLPGDANTILVFFRGHW